tara:strand:+ start:1317 stop:1850 length:534 start_codon:yes stop_codon:yes gene_type:complete
MRRIFFSIILFFSLLLFPSKSYSFDFAPEIGDIAPYFNLKGVNSINKNKTNWDLDYFKNKWLVIYFYPKDFTTGCTIEAKGFSQLNNEFNKNNAEIVGISADSQDSHDSFCNEKSINYTLLSDPDGLVSKKYGSWIPPYSDRNTFLISPDGIISNRWISVTPINHAKEVLNTLKKNI